MSHKSAKAKRRKRDGAADSCRGAIHRRFLSAGTFNHDEAPMHREATRLTTIARTARQPADAELSSTTHPSRQRSSVLYLHSIPKAFVQRPSDSTRAKAAIRESPRAARRIVENPAASSSAAKDL